MAYRRYMVVFSLLIGLALTSIAAFNVLCDPYGAYPSLHLDRLAAHTHEVGTRTARAELLRHGPWDFIILGSSRPQMGYAPDHPSLQGMKACNAAIPGTNLRELQPVVEYALRVSHPQRILLGIDFLLFTAGRDFNQDFAQSRFSPERDLISYHLDNTISLRASAASYEALVSFLRKQPTRFTPLGQTVRHTSKLAGGHRQLFEAKLYEFFTNPESYANFQYTKDRLERFRAIVRSVQDAGVQLDVVINPIHATQFEAIVAAGLWPTFEQWLRDVTRIVEAERTGAGDRAHVRLVSFLCYEPYCDEPIPAKGDTTSVMQYWWESSHFKDTLGGLVLTELYGSLPEGRSRFGTELSPANIDTYIAGLDAARDRWERANPDEVAFVHSIARRAGLID
ncbi:MAG: hypothetical protein Kow0022_06060 [Phycisphaerales bacterium]